MISIANRRLVVSFAIILLVPSLLIGAESLIGMQVEDFTCRSHAGREWSLSDVADKDFLVVAFLGTECPLAKLYGPRLTELEKRFEDQSVAFLGVNANTQDSVTEIAAYANRYQIQFPLLKDINNRVADAMKATRTPEVFILDENRQVRYHGRIDDQYAVGAARNSPQRSDLAIALEELVSGKQVSVAETQAVGCFIGRSKKIEPQGDITYASHIASILNRRCVECHRDGEIAPFPLTNYDEVIGWEDTIVEVIQDRRMPPWFADPGHGEFSNDARLTEQEKQLVFQWVENGMPAGDPEQLPAPPQFTKGWRIPQPDQVFHMRDEPFTVPAGGVVDYKHYVVDPGWEEDKYIYAAEARPDNTSVVHHILVYIIPPGGSERADRREVLVGYAPGSTPVALTDGTALKVAAGSKFLFQMHYTPNGYEQDDRSYAGVCFMDKSDVKTLRKGRMAINARFRIPPRADNHVVKASYTFSRDEMLLSMTPHMHLRGKSFRYDALYPNGDQETLLDVPNYDFNWQLKYILSEPKAMPKGTKIKCTAAFDNSEDNIVNPAPDETVRWGEQSWEEMMIGFFDTVPSQTQQRLSKNVAVDPSGKWSWEREVRGAKFSETLSLSLRDQQLTGVLNSNGKDLKIEDAYVEGDEIHFQANSPQFGGIVLNFEGKIVDQEITGQVNLSLESIGKTFKLPWNAERADDE